MRKIVASALGLILLLIAMVFIWLQFPQVNQPQLVADAQKAAQERHTARQELALDPQRNGFIDPRFTDYWQGLGSTPSAAGKRITAWSVFCSALGAQRIDHQSLQGTPAYIKVRTQFEEMLPDLVAQFHKSIFVAPVQTLALENPPLDYLNMRSLAQALVASAESHIAKQRPREALAPALECLQLGALLQRQGTTTNNFVGLSVQRLGANAFTGLFSPDSALTASQWKACGDTLIASRVSIKRLEEALEDSLLMLANTFAALQASPSARRHFTGGGVAYEIPGVVAREERIALNLAAEALAQFQQGGPILANPPSKSTDWLRGKEGLITPGLVADHHRMHQLALCNRQHLLGLALSSLLLAHRLESGQFPLNLEGLRRGELTKDCTWNSRAQELSVPLNGADSFKETFQLNLYTDKPWLTVRKDSLVFRLQAQGLNREAPQSKVELGPESDPNRPVDSLGSGSR